MGARGRDVFLLCCVVFIPAWTSGQTDPAPVITSQMAVTSETSDSITLIYTASEGQFDEYVFTLVPRNANSDVAPRLLQCAVQGVVQRVQTSLQNAAASDHQAAQQALDAADTHIALAHDKVLKIQSLVAAAQMRKLLAQAALSVAKDNGLEDELAAVQGELAAATTALVGAQKELSAATQWEEQAKADKQAAMQTLEKIRLEAEAIAKKAAEQKVAIQSEVISNVTSALTGNEALGNGTSGILGNIVKETAEVISDGTTGIAGVISNGTTGTLGNIVKETAEVISDGTTEIAGVISNGTTGIAGVISNGTTGIAGVISNGTTGIAGVISNGTTEIAGVISNGTTGIAGVISNGTTGIAGVISNETTGIAGVISNGTIEIAEVISNGTSGTLGNIVKETAGVSSDGFATFGGVISFGTTGNSEVNGDGTSGVISNITKATSGVISNGTTETGAVIADAISGTGSPDIQAAFDVTLAPDDLPEVIPNPEDMTSSEGQVTGLSDVTGDTAEDLPDKTEDILEDLSTQVGDLSSLLLLPVSESGDDDVGETVQNDQDSVEVQSVQPETPPEQITEQEGTDGGAVLDTAGQLAPPDPLMGTLGDLSAQVESITSQLSSPVDDGASLDGGTTPQEATQEAAETVQEGTEALGSLGNEQDTTGQVSGQVQDPVLGLLGDLAAQAEDINTDLPADVSSAGDVPNIEAPADQTTDALEETTQTAANVEEGPTVDESAEDSSVVEEIGETAHEETTQGVGLLGQIVGAATGLLGFGRPSTSRKQTDKSQTSDGSIPGWSPPVDSPENPGTQESALTDALQDASAALEGMPAVDTTEERVGVEELEEAVTSAQATAKEVSTAVSVAEVGVAEAEAQKVAAESSVLAAETVLQTAEQTVQTATAVLQKTTAQLETAAQELAVAEAAAVTVARDAATTIQEYTAQARSIQQRNMQVVQAKSAAQTALLRGDVAVAQAAAQLDAAQTQVASAQSGVDLAQGALDVASPTERFSAQMALDQARTQLSAAQSGLRLAQEMNSAAQQERAQALAALERAQAAESEAASDVSELIAKVTNFQASLAQAASAKSAALAALEAAQEDRAQAASALAAAQAGLRNAQVQHSGAQGTLSTALVEGARAQSTLKEATAALAEAQEALQSAQSELEVASGAPSVRRRRRREVNETIISHCVTKEVSDRDFTVTFSGLEPNTSYVIAAAVRKLGAISDAITIAAKTSKITNIVVENVGGVVKKNFPPLFYPSVFRDRVTVPTAIIPLPLPTLPVVPRQTGRVPSLILEGDDGRPLVGTVTSGTVELTFVDAFGGAADLYSVVVTSDPSDPSLRNPESALLNTWKGARAMGASSWLAVPPCATFFSAPSLCEGVADAGRRRKRASIWGDVTKPRGKGDIQYPKTTVIVGADGDACKDTLSSKYCNGPLETGVYHTCLRGWMLEGGFADAPASLPIEVTGGSSGSDNSLSGGKSTDGKKSRTSADGDLAIALGVCSVVVAAAAVVLVLLYIRDKKKGKHKVHPTKGVPSEVLPHPSKPLHSRETLKGTKTSHA